jgi:hypothetical protein
MKMEKEKVEELEERIKELTKYIKEEKHTWMKRVYIGMIGALRYEQYRKTREKKYLDLSKCCYLAQAEGWKKATA